MTTKSAPASSIQAAGFSDHEAWSTLANHPAFLAILIRQFLYATLVGGSDRVTMYYRMAGCDESEAVELRVQFPNQQSCRVYLDSIPDGVTPEQLVAEWGFTNIGLV